MTVICVYAPEEGRKQIKQEKINIIKIFIFNKHKNRDQVIIARDLNSHVGNLSVPNIAGFFGGSVIN